MQDGKTFNERMELDHRCTQIERLVRLEEKHDNLYSLTEKIADNAEVTTQALQELIVIHKETQTKAAADRKSIMSLEHWIERVEDKNAQLTKVVWRYIYIGTGVFSVLAALWYAGVLPLIIDGGVGG